MSLTDKQQEYLQNCTRRWNLKIGATGSGKTWLDQMIVIPQRLLAMKGQGAAVMIGNTLTTLSRNVLEPMRRIWGEDLVGDVRSKDNTIRLFGKRVHLLGADKASSVDKLQGMTIEYAYGDEMTTWAQPVFEMLKSRLRCPDSHFDGTANPSDPRHWLKAFIDRPDVDLYAQTSTIYDNPHLPPSFIAALEKEYAGTVYFDRFIRGLWVSAQGVIYPLFAHQPQSFHLPENALPGRPDGTPAPLLSDLICCQVGVDFGGDGSAHAFSCVGFTRGFRRLVVLEEYYRREIISPSQLEEDFIAFVRRCQQHYGVQRLSVCFADSAEQTLIQGLRAAVRKARIPLDIRNARKGPINNRIRFLNRLLGQQRFLISPHCPHTEEALCTAVWDDKSIGKDVRLDDGRHNIDSLDAMEYAFEPFMDTMTALC
ncbi:MAG: phage terminase large subunit [Clostridia bacterium]|nr:phage terminase large subunit [Clostridia bacterium]